MLTQEPAPDPKCKLNVSSFLTLSHLLTASFLLQILCPLYCYYKWWRYGIGRGWLIYKRVLEGGTGGGYYLVVFLFFFWLYFCPLFSHGLCRFF